MEESLAKTLYDLVRAEKFVPFSILFATGQRFEIKTREHISLGPVSRSDADRLTRKNHTLEQQRAHCGLVSS